MRRLSIACLLAAACTTPETFDAGTVGRRDAGVCAPFAFVDDLAPERARCTFAAGASTLETLGIGRERAARIPITHVIVVMQENRSFDHYFATLSETHPEVDALPPGFANMDATGGLVAPFRLDFTCLEADPPHQWDGMHAQWNDGAMDGFVRTAAVSGSDGHYAVGYYEERDLPFYHWLARTFAIGDRYFCSVLSGTWSNRNVLYTGSTYGVRNTGERTIPEARTIFDQLDDAGVSWGVYTDGFPRQDKLGWGTAHAGVFRYPEFLARVANGTLPQVVFLDPGPDQDEHPPADIQLGEAWSREIYEASRASPLWPGIALLYTYDEGGGLFDHVPPPEACPPSADLPELNVLGMRVPLIVVSPWARPGHVSHEVGSHSSIVRMIQLLFDLPALTARDASADALLDYFEFDCDPDFIEAPQSPPAGTGGC